MSIHTFKKEFLGEFGDFEVFHAEKGTLTNSVFPSNENPAGWYWKTVSDAFSLPGEAVGPFSTEQEAIEHGEQAED